MTKPLDVIWEAVQNLGDHHPGTTTALGTTTTLTDANLGIGADVLKDGLLFVLTGTYIGIYKILGNTAAGVITYSPATAAGIPASVEYGVCLAPPNAPSYDMLRNSLKNELTKMKYHQVDATLVVLADTYEYSLPTGVSDVRRVEVAQSSVAPYSYAKHFWWDERNGKIYFDSNHFPGTVGNPIRLWYCKKHAVIADTADINAAIDYDVLLWATITSVWRKLLVTTHKDNPVAVELFNEAKSNYNLAKLAMEPLMMKDPRYA